MWRHWFMSYGPREVPACPRVCTRQTISHLARAHKETKILTNLTQDNYFILAINISIQKVNDFQRIFIVF